MMNGNTEFVEEGQSHHPFYCMYKYDHSNIDGVNTWIRWFCDRKYKLVLETQFVPFDAIRLEFNFKGLFVPGLGTNRYADCTSALMEILPCLLPPANLEV